MTEKHRAKKRWNFGPGWAVWPLVGLFAACAPNGDNEVANRALTPSTALPPMKSFVAHTNGRTLRSNADLTRDFLDLYFKIETGRELPVLSRFEGQITLNIKGVVPRSFPTDMTRLISRMRNEAGLKIALTDRPDASISIISKQRSTLEAAVPGAACFVVPNVGSWHEFLEKRAADQISWVDIRERKRLAIFVPHDAPPQELRDCMHEELAQAIGPLNDLYRLPDSTFNDDNFHSVLTAFDMLMLRAAYDPALRSGMTKAEVAAKIPGILRRLNPAGETRVATTPQATSKEWAQAIHLALGVSGVQVNRQDAALRAIQFRQSPSQSDVRDGFANYAHGRLVMRNNPAKAALSMQAADAIFSQHKDTAIHRANVAVQLASFALMGGDAQQVLDYVTPQIPVAMDHENAALLASLLMLRAEALDLTGRSSEAQLVRLDSLGWARYGYGSATAVFERLAEIQALNPANNR